VKNLAAIMGDDNEDKQDPESSGRNDEEINGNAGHPPGPHRGDQDS